MNKKLIPLSFLGILALSLGYFQFPQFFSKSAPTVAQSTANDPAALLAISQGPATPPVASIASTAKIASPLSSPLAAASSIRPETTTFLEAVLNQPVSIEHGGAMRELALAKDELYVRNADGIGRVVSIPSAGSASELLAQIEKLQKEIGSAPELILYPTGAARNDSTRRIVTRDILIEADSRSAADSLAASSGLSFKSAPIYAKGKFIYEAPSSPEALAFFVKTADAQSPYVTPLLGAQMAKRIMPNDPLVQKQWHLKFQNQVGAVSGTDINVESVWKYPKTKAFVAGSGNTTTDYIRGNGVVIGIVDDGLEWSHPDLLPNVIKNLQKDWNGKDNDPKPDWGNNHGTACAGVAAARGNNKLGVCGVAPEANLVGMRLTAGVETDLDEAEAEAWYPDQIQIKSNSWGPSDDGLTLKAPDSLTEAALKYAADFGRGGKGTIITWAGGNGRSKKDYSNYDGYANSIYSIAVAATNCQGTQAWYSESGANLVISAPSNGGPLGIMTTDIKGPKGYNYGVLNIYGLDPVNDFKGSADVTQTFGGTSSATPAVSGVIALMLQRNPNLGWRDVQEILMRTAVQVDASDSDWITNNATVPFHFNHRYGAGLVDAAAAVSLSGNWTNLKSQKSQTVTTNATTAIGANATITRNFTVTGTSLRVEHATLELTITNIPKGDLNITLTSPGNTTSTFCQPHGDTKNQFTNWKFMTVRNWAESSNGTWTLTITNNGTFTGNLTDAELVIYGTEAIPTNPPPVVTLTPSVIRASVSANITLNATAIDLTANATTGNVTKVEFFRTFNGTSTKIGEDTTVPYSIAWNTANLTAGNYTLTANATDSQGAVGTSKSIVLRLDAPLIAGWDFQTPSNGSTVPLTTALYSTRTYKANFGIGNGILFMNGTNGSSRRDVSAGEVFSGIGTTENVGAGFSTVTTNPAALLLPAGKNLSGNGKSLVFSCNSTANKTYTISYAAMSAGGYSTHSWSWSNNPTGNFTSMGNATLGTDFSTLSFSTSNATSNGTLYLRLTPSGATSASGTNLIDNIQIQSN